QLVDRQERVQLGGIEPETGKLPRSVFALHQNVAVTRPVVLDRGTHVETHVPDDAGDGRPLALELVLELRVRYRLAGIPENRVQAGDAIEEVHVPSVDHGGPSP